LGLNIGAPKLSVLFRIDVNSAFGRKHLPCHAVCTFVGIGVRKRGVSAFETVLMEVQHRRPHPHPRSKRMEVRRRRPHSKGGASASASAFEERCGVGTRRRVMPSPLSSSPTQSLSSVQGLLLSADINCCCWCFSCCTCFLPAPAPPHHPPSC